MTRRTTVIQPSRKTNALYTLPPQPFARRIVSACLFEYTPDDANNNQSPQLKIADVSGNVLAFITPTFNPSGIPSITPYTYFFGENLGDYVRNDPGGTLPTFIPASIPSDLTIPQSNLFTITIEGSADADTIPNLVLVTEDEDDEFLY